MAEFRLLGPVELLAAGQSLDLGPPKQRAVFAAFVIDAGRPVTVATLVHRVWDDEPPAEARNALYAHIMRVRRILARAGEADGVPLRLERRADGYLLDADRHSVDLHQFRHLAEQAREPGLTDSRRAALLREALGLWRGTPLGGLGGSWAARVRESCLRQRADAMVAWARTELALGNHDVVIGPIRDMIDEYPLVEPLAAVLMRALFAAGRTAEALDCHASTRRLLVAELGVDPGTEMQDVHDAILRGELCPPPTPAPPAPQLDVPTVSDEWVMPVSTHCQLPPDFADFVGREPELLTMDQALPRTGQHRTAPTIVAIEGMPGVGKTRLAVHLAHQLVHSGQYADLQLYVDLRGYADVAAAEPGTVLASFLRLIGVPGPNIPEDLDGRAALYRDRLHDKRVLVLLDNAASLQQVLPLLPASATALVLITSRRMVAVDGATTMTLDVFTPAEAERLLAHIVGRQRVDADPAGASRVVDLCGRLPLAVGLAARRLQSRPAWRFEDLTSRLAEKEHRLDELAAGDRQVRTVFNLSVQALEDACQRLFRQLGLHPGDDFTTESAAALAGLAPGPARHMLDRLVDERLLVQVTSGRYRLHDLLREYARELAGDSESEEAVDKVLTWYLHASDAAVQVMFPHQRDVELDRPQGTLHLPAFDDDEQAFRWLTAEHATLVACIHMALGHGRYDVSWQLSAVLRQWFEYYSRFDEWIATTRIALRATRRGHHRAGEALTLSVLGLVYGHLERIEQAIECLNESLQIRRALGDRAGEAKSLNNLGVTYGRRGSLPEAIACFSESLRIRREMGARYYETVTLSNLGRAFAGLGQHEDAIACFEQALDIRSQLNDRVGISLVLYNLAEALLRAGQHPAAVNRLEEVLQIHREKHMHRHTAETLDLLGQALWASGERDHAEKCWHEAVSIFDELGLPSAQPVRLRLIEAAEPHVGPATAPAGLG